MKAFIIFMVHCHPRMLRVLLLMFCFFISFATSRDTITSSQFIKEPETLTSNNGMFNLGFFTPQNSTFTYLGIWYESKSSVVWIANRNQPLRDSSGILNISEDGNLVLLNGQKQVIWTTNVSDIASGTSAQLQDSGNLALVEGTTGGTVWQSFQHPSDTLLPKMKLISHKNSGERVKLTSSKSPSDPSVGDFSMSLESLSIPEVLVWNGSHPYWRTGPWNSQVFLGIPNMKNVYLDGFQFAEEEHGTYYLTYTYANSSVFGLTIFVISSQGKLEQKGWDHEKEEWEVEWTSQESECDIYGTCGAFGSCNSKSSPICSCLRGFEPRNPEEWNRQNWTSGCVRRELLQCERVKNGSEAGKNDGFLKLQKMKVPYFAQWTDSEVSCRIQCLNNCSCVAYAYDGGIGCMLWSGNLIDIQSFGFGGTDLYIRVAYSELDKKRNVILIITVTVIIGTILIVTCGYFLWKWATRREKRHDIILGRSKIGDLNQVELQDISLYDFGQLAAATNNFHRVNKLGQGGFGPVYKGTLESGQEIAVKRLSRASGQGLEEFMNEVVVISKLQHRNLVKLLGCCTEGDEKMLIYEYMPNKSLESYIFDSLKQNVLLGWKKRFNILEGIARGLLYLHRDSRLRIIHRDLKLSNILLDNDLNPKISDFGMARIFEHNVDEVNTRRIVGTFGYISPEYAMEGLFSEKSDVFSFGVLLLEIISGKKNTSFCEYSEALSLLGFAWKLWNDGNIASLIDPEIYDPRFLEDIARCIHLGLLCVQELARDRPTMTTIISMLNSEIVNLPPPRQPAFTHRQTLLDAESSQKSDGLFSINYVSVTNIKGR